MKNKSGLSITNGFKIILGEHRKPEKLWVERGSEFYNKTFKSLLKEYETELYSIYSDLKTLFIERFNRTLLHIINKPMFINGDCIWVNVLIDAVVTYNNNVHSTINMTSVDASNNPDKDILYLLLLRLNQTVNLATPNLKSVIMSKILTNVTFSVKVTLLIGIEKCLKLMKF